MTKRICLWSGPRTVSTALMYSFARRDDTLVIDEPLYGYYLKTSGAPHPGREEVMAAMETDAEKVIREVVFGEYHYPVVFMKHMTHHLINLDRNFLKQTINVLFIRDPRQMLPSLINQLPRPTLRDTGLGIQSELFYQLKSWGQIPLVLDSRELLLDPRDVLTQLCEKLDIPFQSSMLSWPPGPRPEDGIWAKHWYHNLHKSTGFQPYREKRDPFPDKLLPLLQECQPHYDYLQQQAIKAEANS